MSVSEYFDNLPLALMIFQHLETALKFYIRDCDRIIQSAVKGSFHYSVREKDIERMPLGRLVEEFSRRTNRKDIISLLKKLNAHRNYVAHTAYLLTEEETENSKRMAELSRQLTQVTKVAKACLKELVREHSRITGEPFPEEILKQL
jgi:hypothetical protein